MVCTNCGNSLDSNAKFCTKCGENISDMGNDCGQFASNESTCVAIPPKHRLQKINTMATYLKSIAITVVLTMIIFSIMAILITYTDFEESIIPRLTTVVMGISIVVNGIFVGRCLKRKGWMHGALLGVIYVGLIILMSWIILKEVTLGLMNIYKMASGIVGGGIGGAIGAYFTEREANLLMHCKECGIQLSRDAQFCSNCGVDVKNEDNLLQETSTTIDGENQRVSKKPIYKNKMMYVVLMLMVTAAIGTLLQLPKADDGIRFEVLNENTIPEKINEVLPRYKPLERALVCKIDADIYIIVTRGEKPTGGYMVDIDKIQKLDAEGKAILEVHTKFTDPKPGDVTTQEITYPYQVVKTELKELPDKIELKVKDDD